MSKDDEIARVVARLETLLDELAGNVAALSSILEDPAEPDPDDDRLVAP